MVKRLFNITKEKEKKDVWWIPFRFQKTIVRKTHAVLWYLKVLAAKVTLVLLPQVCMFWELAAASRATQPVLPKDDGAGDGCRLPRSQPVQKAQPVFPDTLVPGKDFASMRRHQQRREVWMLMAVGCSSGEPGGSPLVKS